MTDIGQDRILVVDDGAENREILVDLLGSEGYTVDTAVDGAEAVEKALASPPDLILMDVSMPRMTGFEACRRLKADERTHLVPPVLVTGLVAPADRTQGTAAGPRHLLTEPRAAEPPLARTRRPPRAHTPPAHSPAATTSASTAAPIRTASRGTPSPCPCAASASPTCTTRCPPIAPTARPSPGPKRCA